MTVDGLIVQERKITHFLIVLSQSRKHDQCTETFALQMVFQVALACWVGITPSALLLELSRQSTSNPVFGEISYQSLELFS